MPTLNEFVQKHFRKRFFRWVDRHIVAKSTHRLSRKNLFIFPSSMGLVFLLVTMIVWLLGTNYQNNLILALAFFMIGLLIVSILHTFQNVSNISLSCVGSSAIFAGELAQVRLHIDATNKRRASEAMLFFWQGYRDIEVEHSFSANSKEDITLPIQTHRRGVLALPRLGLVSTFPLGLIRTWSWLRLDHAVVVYPKPVSGPLHDGAIEDEEGDANSVVAGGHDFAHLREHEDADGLRNIDWKAYARGQGLLVKTFEQYVSSDNWLDFSLFTALALFGSSQDD